MIGFLIAAQFAMITSTDEVTLEQQAGLVAADNGNMLGLICRPGNAEIGIFVRPDGYDRSDAARGYWPAAKADSRFGQQKSPEMDAWLFSRETMKYAPGFFPSPSKTAEFIDMLARDSRFNIRFDLARNEVRSVTINYSIDQAELKRFVAMCGPRRVIARLKEMGSPAAPE